MQILLNLRNWPYGPLVLLGAWCEDVQCRYKWVSVGFSYKVVYRSRSVLILTVVPKKLMLVGLVSCVNFVVGCILFRYSIYSLIKGIFPMVDTV